MVTVSSSSCCIFLKTRHIGACPLFFSSFLESRLVGFYFEGHFILCTYIRIISLIVFVVAFPFTFPFT